MQILHAVEYRPPHVTLGHPQIVVSINNCCCCIISLLFDLLLTFTLIFIFYSLLLLRLNGMWSLMFCSSQISAKECSRLLGGCRILR